MARVDDYQMSFDLSAQHLAKRDWPEVALFTGLELAPDSSYLLGDYYGRPLKIEANPVRVVLMDDGPPMPLAEQALVLHYLERADGTLPSGEWVTFREMESGEFYWSAFVKRAKDPLVKFFGERPELLKELAPLVGGRQDGEAGHVSMVVRALPRAEFLLVLWEGDEEFPPDGNVLMDRNLGHYLSTEDIALAAGMCIYKMMALARC